jgi:hypothetical protein
MAQPIWQREHGPDIVSEATTDANGFWIARAFSRSNPTAVVRTPKPLDSRHSACAKADALARRMFLHVCEVPGCRNWALVPSEMVRPRPATDVRVVKLT